MKYNSEKDAKLLKKDKFLQKFPLNIDEDEVEIVPVEKVFE